jgi:streptomycin 6-kinase
MVEVPVGFAEATTLREGDAGRAWLEGLPAIVDDACRRWRCTVDGEPTHGQVALVVPVRHPRGPAVLKVSFPHQGNLGEAAALRTFAGNGAVELLEVDDTGLVFVLERAQPLTLAEYAARGPIEQAIEVAGELASRLAVDPQPGITRLAETTQAWTEQLHSQVTVQPDALPAWVVDQARATIEHLAADETATMLHGDLLFGNILRSSREPWLTIDPKGWSGTAAFDTFTVIAGRREELDTGRGLYMGIVGRIHRFAAVARVDPDLALACCQARAVSSYLYQLQVRGAWFDLEFLRVLAHGGNQTS